MSPTLLAVAGDAISRDLIIPLGAAAGTIAVIAIALVLPLYVSQRREVRRLMRWREREPERGDEGAPEPVAAAMPTTGSAAAVRPAASYGAGTRMTPAERVTADRPALSRITAERAALQSPSFWRRLMARGPRHPLVLSLIGILLAVGAVVVAFHLTDQLGGGTKSGAGAGFDKSQVPVVVLNASSTPAVAEKVAHRISSRGFTQVRTGVTGETKQTVILYAKGSKHQAAVVGRALKAKVLQPIDRARQALAPDADVVVVAGEDRAKG